MTKGNRMRIAVIAGLLVAGLDPAAYAISLLVAAPGTEPSQQVASVLSLVGGLVAALVVAVLAITPAGGNPARLFFGGSTSAIRAVTVIAWAYLLVWLGCGGTLLITWMGTTVPSKALGAAATSWLGLAVAAAYSYLGLKPPAEKETFAR